MKKQTITFMLLLSAIILSSCGNRDNQAESSHTGAGAETSIAGQFPGEDDIQADDIPCFTDLGDMDEKLRADWQEQLGETVYSYGGCRSDVQKYIGASQNSGEELEFSFYFYTLDRFSIPTFYKTTAYGYIEDNSIYVMSRTQEAFHEIINAAQARELAGVMSGIFIYEFGLADYEEQDGNLATIISYLGLADGRMFDGEADLTTPEAAIGELLHYSGGVAKSIPRDIYGNARLVTYTFADGSTFSWNMTQRYEYRSSNGLGMFWFPTGACSREAVAEAKKIEEYMTDVSAELLRGITKEVDYTVRDWLTLPEDNGKDSFVLLGKEEEKDIAYYGLYGGMGIVLRDGNDIYPIYAEWIQMGLPVIRKADYDNDGTEEYALWQIVGTGTGFHQQELFMLEPDPEQETGLRVHEFTTTDMQYQFATIDYTFDEETHMLTVETNAQSAQLDLTEYLEMVNEEYREEYQGLGWGDIIYIEEKEGEWYLVMPAGIMLSDCVQPDYACGMVFAAPITYMENGYFQTGAVSIEPVYDYRAF